MGDAAIGNNQILRLIAGTIFMHEQDYNEALKYTNAGGTIELLSLTLLSTKTTLINLFIYTLLIKDTLYVANTLA